MKHFWNILCALVVATCFSLAHASDSPEEIDRKAHDLYQKVFSPFCPGRSLNDCPSSKAQELKAEMRSKLESGVPPETILEGVFETFGQKYRAVPQYSGFGKLVWWVPLGFLAIGMVVVFLTTSRQKQGSAGADNAQSESLAPETKAAIEKELASLDR
jgi:cytochrome c-type biogenesis protein CcmH/NrfF